VRAARPEPRRRFRYRARPEINGEQAVHVSIRLRDGTWSLRKKSVLRIVRVALAAANAKIRFRLLHYSIQGNHLHLIVEADDTYALSRAMRSLSIRIAKQINALMGERGVRIPVRYHMTVLKTPLEAYLAIRYVLNNYRRHAKTWGEFPPADWIDPCSSAASFDGWSRQPARARDPCPDLGGCTSPARSFLMREAWRPYGPIDPDFAPGPMSGA
jgi:REP element-mobilizing transposase RayT